MKAKFKDQNSKIKDQSREARSLSRRSKFTGNFPATTSRWVGTRFGLLIFVLFLSFELCALCFTACAAPLPNIVFIVSDDEGWRDIGYRHPDFSTPNLDRLAATGVKLEHHYVWPTCSPTRCAIVCGRNPANFGILGPIGGKSTLVMPRDIPNLATVLKSRGYFTAITGKWHLSLQIENGPRQ